MNETLDCTNCCIADFKHSLCDCHGDFCTKYKSIGDENDFMKAVLMDRPSGEVDAVKEYERQVHNLNQGYITLGEFDKRIEPLRHLHYDRPSGEWIPATWNDAQAPVRLRTHKCSVCGEKAERILVRTELIDNYYCNKCEPITEYTHQEQLSDYCPHCGAYMRGKDDD